MKPSYSTAVVIGALAGLVLALALFVLVAASGGIPSLEIELDGTDVIPTIAASASATWTMIVLASAVAGAIIATVTYAVARVIEPGASAAPLIVVAPLGAVIAAVVGVVVFPIGVTIMGSISEGNAIIGVADMVILAATAGLVSGGSVAWLSYILSRPSAPEIDTELLAT
jgi:hypothetical protein